MLSPRVVLLTIDGLRASALGAYGNTWRPTPALDRLAYDSLLVEWAEAASPDPVQGLLTALGDGPWTRRRLVTDDLQFAASAESCGLDQITPLELPEIRSRATSIGETGLAAVFGAFADAVVEKGDTPCDEPTLTWLHCRGFAGPWDAPMDLVEELVEEEDPTPPRTVEPPSGAVDRRADPDAIFTAACRYAAQVAVLDACLDGWLDLIVGDPAVRPAVVALLGTRGYSLGEHGQIGLEEAGPYTESRHVPLLLRTTESAGGQRWSETPLAAEAAPALLAQLAADPTSERAEQALTELGAETLAMTAAQQRAVRTLQWRLVQPNEQDRSPQLFLKPDDRWEANDVASLRPDVVDELSLLLPNPPR